MRLFSEHGLTVNYFYNSVLAFLAKLSNFTFKILSQSHDTKTNQRRSSSRAQTDYSGVKDLEFSSHGLFTEGNYYFTDAFYGGLRFALNFNWVAGESQKKFDDVPDIDSPTFFTGIAGYMHLGYHQPIGKNIGIKFQAQIGLHNYKIAQGWLLVDNSSDDIRNAQFGIEKHAAFLYNLSVGFTYKL